MYSLSVIRPISKTTKVNTEAKKNRFEERFAFLKKRIAAAPKIKPIAVLGCIAGKFGETWVNKGIFRIQPLMSKRGNIRESKVKYSESDRKLWVKRKLFGVFV